MQDDEYELARSLGYEFLEENDDGQPVYVKNGLKWIENYADLADFLQQQQDETLSANDIQEKYKYNVDDYYFYVSDDENILLERQQKWIENGIVNFVNIYDDDINELIIEDCDILYSFYKVIDNKNQPFNILVGDDERTSYEMYLAIKSARDRGMYVRRSVYNALEQGYEYYEPQHNNHFKPFMFRKKDNKKWIHNITRLKKKFNSIQDLEDEGYNVDDYYMFNASSKEDCQEYLEWVFLKKIVIPHIEEIIRDEIILLKDKEQEAFLEECLARYTITIPDKERSNLLRYLKQKSKA